MAGKTDKSIMRSLGEFVGHVWAGIKTDPSKPGQVKRKTKTKKQVLEKETREELRGDVTLRETTIREIEFRERSEDHDDR